MRILRYTVGGVMCVIAVVAARAGVQWYWLVLLICGAFLVIVGKRRIFHAGVTRTEAEVICRYVPWFEGNVYYLNFALPVTGVATAAAGFAPGNPAWLRFGGIILIVLTPLFTSSAYRMRRRSFLRITSSELSTQSATPKDELAVIPRSAVESISPKIVSNGVGGEWLQVEICYRTDDLSNESKKTVLLGLQLTVEPINLLNALVAWRDATTDSDQLLDRVEGLLRGLPQAA